MRNLLSYLLALLTICSPATSVAVKHPLIEAHDLLQANEVAKAQQLLLSFTPTAESQGAYDYLLALVYLENKQTEPAYTLLKKCRNELPEELAPTITFIRLLRQLKNYDEAFQVLLEAQLKFTNSPILTEEEIAFLVAQGLFFQALQKIELLPNRTPAIRELQIQLCLWLNKEDQALSLALEYYFSSNFSPSSSRLLATVYAKNGLYSPAAAILELHFLEGETNLAPNISFLWQQAGANQQSLFFNFAPAKNTKKH